MKNKKKILDGLDAVKKVQGILTDAQAAECSDLYPEWDGNGKAYTAGDRVLYEGTLYRCIDEKDHISQPGWAPDIATSLWAEILPGQDGTAIGEWQQPGSENGYKKGDRVTHSGKTWESIVDDVVDSQGRIKGANVWEPGVYGWVEIAG